MNKTSGNLEGRGQWGESFITSLSHHQLQRSRNFAHLSNNDHQMGEKKLRFNAGLNFCTSKNISSFQLNLDPFLIKRPCCVLLAQKTGIASRVLKSQLLAHRGSMVLGQQEGGLAASHLCPSDSPHHHHCRGELSRHKELKDLSGVIQWVSDIPATGTTRMNEAHTQHRLGHCAEAHLGVTKRDLSCQWKGHDGETGQ